MHLVRATRLVALSVFAICLVAPARAAGPGLPNITYPAADVMKPIATITSAVGASARGHSSVTMVDGYLFVPFGVDSGNPGGGFSFYDISNPRAPLKVSQVNDSALREAHGFGFTTAHGGTHVAMQTTTGVQIWNVSNPLVPTKTGTVAIPGVSASDYALGAWWVFWQAPYIYVGASGNGLAIIDASNPASPVHVKTVPTSAWGGFKVGPVFAIGNLLVASNMDASGLVTFDISDPLNPAVLGTSQGGGGQYAITVNGERILSAGSDNRLRVYDIANPASIVQTVVSPAAAGKGGYLTVQDGFAHSGMSSNYTKFNLATGAIVATASSGISDRDEDFAVVLGNLVFIGNDHSTGSVLVPHQSAPDTTAPTVNMVSPKAGATNVATTSRVGITLTDDVDLRTVNSSTFLVRPSGGSALSGKYSAQSGIVNFSPNAPLQAGTTYEVIVPAGGLKDHAGNAIATAFSATFTTGGTQMVACTLAPRSALVTGGTADFMPASTIGTGLTYSWNFGDGTSTPFSGSASASRTYANPGHYPVVLTVMSGAQSGTCSATQTVHNATTATAPRASGTMVHDATRGRVWVVNSDSASVSALTVSSHTKYAEVPVGINPQTIAQAPNGRLWVTNHGSDSITLLDPDTGNTLQTITLARGTRPFGVAFNPAGTSAYVTVEGTGQLLRFNAGTGAYQTTVTVGPTPRGIAISADGSRIFVSRYISPSSQGEIVEVNASSHTVTRTMALANDAGPDTESSGRGVPNFISSLAISPDGQLLWIPSKKDNTSRGTWRDGLPLTFDSTVRSIVSQINLSTNVESTSARIDLNDRDMANAVAFTPLGDYVFVSTQGTNTVEVIDAYTRQLVTGAPSVGRAPRGMVLAGNKLFVNNFMGRTVSVYDVGSLLNWTSTSVNKLADVSTITTEPLTAQVLQGKRVFYNADDARMNRDKYISCASCHQDGGQDGRVWDFTDRGEGLRNTIALNGRRGMGHGRVHWTGNFNEIQDFEHDMRGAFGGTGFLTNAQFNTGTRNTPLGDPKAGLNADLDALAAYVTSLQSHGRSPYRNADGSLTADGLAGRSIFLASGCASCHSGSDMTDSSGGVLRNVGTIKASSGMRLGAPLTGLDTPTLKGLWDSAPYLHDGSATTLLQVITTANPGNAHGNTSTLTATQQQQLVAYLMQLDESVEPGASVGITALTVADTANAADWSVQSNLQTQVTQYGDRTYRLTSIPSDLLGATWLRTANDSKRFAGNPTVTFTIDRAADIYVGVDSRGARPAWMDVSWTQTASTLTNNESVPRTFQLYKKSYAAGTVSLGGNTAPSMYTVIAK